MTNKVYIIMRAGLDSYDKELLVAVYATEVLANTALAEVKQNPPRHTLAEDYRIDTHELVVA